MDQFSTVCIDFDNTIIPWGPMWRNSRPFSGVRDAIKELEKQGYYIYILTSRISNAYCESQYQHFGFKSAEEFQAKQIAFVISVLDLNGIPFNDVGSEKVPALAYFDDLAVRVTPEYPLPAAIYDFIEGNRG